jgi:mannose-6-phosphate isomerase-like protein (cupin superfamily)
VTQTVLVPEVGTELSNPVTGGRTVFTATAASTAGAYVEVRHTYPPRSPHPPLHLHPEQDERFVLEQGRLHAVVGDEERELAPGDVLDVPRGTPHSMWSVADEPTVVLWRTTPALRTDALQCDLWSAQAAHGFAAPPLALFEVALRYGPEFQLC